MAKKPDAFTLAHIERVKELTKQLIIYSDEIDPFGEPQTLYHFFNKNKYPWCSFLRLIQKNEEVAAAFDLVKQKLHMQWFNYAMRSNDLPKQKAWLIQKYIEMYDPYFYSLKAQLNQERVRQALNYMVYNTEIVTP